MPKVLLLNDYPGYQRVALAAQAPILESRGVEVFRLPTALLSNTLNYGDVARLDTTEYICETLQVWERLGFRFDAIATGFFNSSEQSRVILEYCKEQRQRGAALFCDPVMADYGKLYSGVPADRIEELRAFARVADYMTPNYTEGCLLAGIPWKPVVTGREARELLDKLRSLGVKHPVVTSVPLMGDPGNRQPAKDEAKEENPAVAYAVIGYDAGKGEYVEERFVPVHIRYYGTGDCFMAFFLNCIMQGEDLSTAIRHGMRGVEGLLQDQAFHRNI